MHFINVYISGFAVLLCSWLAQSHVFSNSEATMLSRPDGTLALVDSYSRLGDVATDINVGVELSVVYESFVVADSKTLPYSKFG